MASEIESEESLETPETPTGHVSNVIIDGRDDSDPNPASMECVKNDISNGDFVPPSTPAADESSAMIGVGVGNGSIGKLNGDADMVNRYRHELNSQVYNVYDVYV